MVFPYFSLTSQSIYLMLSRRAKEAGVERFSPHDLRRTFVSQLLDRKVDIATVSKMAGHSSVSITERYDRRGEQAKKKAVQVLSFPK
jgi:integrase